MIRSQRKGPGAWPGPRYRNLLARGAELRGHVRESVLQLTAERIHDRNDRDGNAGGDKAVFDGGRAGLVVGEALEHGRHQLLLTKVHTWLSELGPIAVVSRPTGPSARYGPRC